MAYVADKAYYHDGDGHLYESGGPGRELLVRKGGELRDADAARFGLIEPPKRGTKAKKDAPAAPAETTPAPHKVKAKKSTQARVSSRAEVAADEPVVAEGPSDSGAQGPDWPSPWSEPQKEGS